jgi:hypothetical protein
VKKHYGWLGVALATVLNLLTVSVQAQAPATVSLENEFVRVVANRGPSEAGRFSIRTTGGDPTRAESQNQPLIYGGNAPGTSYTTVRIDGKDYLFGGPTVRRAGNGATCGTLVTEMKSEGGKLICSYRFDDIEVTQELTIVRSQYSRMLDSVGITYRLRNTGATAHQVGIRVVQDTMCGKNDGAVIRPSGMAEITTATWLTGDKVPEFIQAFDSLASPVVIAQGTLRGGVNTPPDKVLLADWGTLADEMWEPAIKPGQDFTRAGEDEADTAAALFWNPVTLEANQSTSYVTTYGMGNVNVKIGGLTVGLTCQSNATYEYERTKGFTVQGYVENTKDFEARNVVLTLTLPEGLTLAGGSKLKRSYGTMKPGDPARQESWLVQPNGKSGGTQTIVLEVTSDNVETTTVKRTVDLVVPAARLQFTPSAQTLPLLSNGQPTVIPMQVSVTPAEALAGVRLTIVYDPKVLKAFDISRGRAFVEDGALLPDWSYTLDGAGPGTIVIRATRGVNFPLTQAEAHVATIKFYAVAAGNCDVRALEALALSDAGATRPLETTPATFVITGAAR